MIPFSIAKSKSARTSSSGRFINPSQPSATALTRSPVRPSREVSKNSSLSERIYEVCAERDSLKGKVRDYERVRRAIGPEQADRILEAAYQQEQAEKERKRAARQKTRVGVR